MHLPQTLHSDLFACVVPGWRRLFDQYVSVNKQSWLKLALLTTTVAWGLELGHRPGYDQPQKQSHADGCEMLTRTGDTCLVRVCELHLSPLCYVSVGRVKTAHTMVSAGAGNGSC